MKNQQVQITVRNDNEVVGTIYRVPQYESGWAWVYYQNKRYQLFGGFHVDYRIQLKLPITSRNPGRYNDIRNNHRAVKHEPKGETASSYAGQSKRT